jgi:NADH:ubiquinone oxidoreductase subunit C
MDPKQVREVFAELHKRKGWLHLSTITGADMKDSLLAVYHVEIDKVLVSFFARLDRDNPEIETIVDIVPGVRIFERELWDMFGVMVHGNHSEDTVMLPDDWPKGVFPLRKDVKPGGGDN